MTRLIDVLIDNVAQRVAKNLYSGDAHTAISWFGVLVNLYKLKIK